MAVVKGVKTRKDVYPTNDALMEQVFKKKCKPDHIQIGMPPAFDPPTLNVTHFDGSVETVKISIRAAAVLIAHGFSTEG